MFSPRMLLYNGREQTLSAGLFSNRKEDLDEFVG